MVFYLLLKPFKIIRLIVPVIIVIGIAIGIPHYLNQKIDNQIEELTKEDFDPENPIQVHGTIAVIRPEIYVHNEASWAFKHYRQLSYKLLYKQGVDALIIADTNEENSQKARRYFIEKKDDCTENDYKEFDNLDYTSKQIKEGECLSSVNSSLNDANIIYTVEDLNYPSQNSLLSAFISIEATRHTIKVKNKEKENIAFQYTALKTQKIVSPLLFKLIFPSFEVQFLGYKDLTKAPKTYTRSRNPRNFRILPESQIDEILEYASEETEK